MAFWESEAKQAWEESDKTDNYNKFMLGRCIDSKTCFKNGPFEPELVEQLGRVIPASVKIIRHVKNKYYQVGFTRSKQKAPQTMFLGEVQAKKYADKLC